jgi:hypothetical protein
MERRSTRLVVLLTRVPFLIVGSHNRKAEPFEGEEKRKESRTDDPEHGWFIGTTSHEDDPNIPSIIQHGHA